MRGILILLAAILAAVSCQSHDLLLGQPTFGDNILYKLNQHKYGIPFITRTTELEYPEPGQPNFSIIRAIHIKDHYYDGNGGYAYVNAGGVGQKYAKIKLKSQRGNGFNFTVTIWGRYY